MVGKIREEIKAVRDNLTQQRSRLVLDVTSILRNGSWNSGGFTTVKKLHMIAWEKEVWDTYRGSRSRTDIVWLTGDGGRGDRIGGVVIICMDVAEGVSINIDISTGWSIGSGGGRGISRECSGVCTITDSLMLMYM